MEIGCTTCGHPINCHISNASNNYACPNPNCGEYIMKTIGHCWVIGCKSSVIKDPAHQDGIYGYKCGNGHSFRMHPEWGMGGINDIAKCTGFLTSGSTYLRSFPNSCGLQINEEMIYFWTVSGKEGKAMIERML